MRGRWQWLLLQFSKRLWVGTAAFALLGAASVLLAAWISPGVPQAWAERIDAGTIETILQILASSMLVVATFSLSSMLQAYGAATTATTPRVARLLMGDRVAQLALSTFIGAFLFSLVGILALGAGLYDANGRVVLFGATTLVIILIVVTFVGWIDHATRLGRVGYGIERAAKVASMALLACQKTPHLGGRPPVRLPEGAVLITAPQVGYVRHVDVAALDEVAQKMGAAVHVAVRPGALVDTQGPIAWLTTAPDEALRRRVQAAFAIGGERSFEQDPRLGVAVLAEIAAKALSPAVNDGGTAIEVLAALHRVLAEWAEEPTGEVAEPASVHVPLLTVDDVFEDAFDSLSAAGAGTLTVGIRLQKTLGRLATLDAPGFDAAARHQSALALARAREALPLDADVERLAALALRSPST